MKQSIYTKNRASDWVTTKQLIAIGSEILILRLRSGHAYGSDRLGLVRRDLVLKKGAICTECGETEEDPIDPSELRIVELNHDSPLTEPNKKIDNNLGEYIVLKNTSGRNLALGNVQVGQGGNWWQFSATDTLVPNAYALVCYGTVVDQAQFLSANNLPLALTTDPTVQWHWQSTISFPDAEGQATVRLFENGKPGATLDQVYWNPDGLQANNAYCDATCQVDPSREAVVSLQLDDFTYDPINPWDASKWTTAEATARGKGSSQPEAPTAVRGLLKKEYELKDHLGNVHVVVTDRKHSTISAGPSIGEFKADVIVMRDYYPFGMEMEGQRYVGGDYRYGFNGMERDDEMKGSGASYDFGARMYDPRVGRWWSVDAHAKKYPTFSPYQFVANSPILLVDIDGNDTYVYDRNSKLILIVVDGKEIQGYRLDLEAPPFFEPRVVFQGVEGYEESVKLSALSTTKEPFMEMNSERKSEGILTVSPDAAGYSVQFEWYLGGGVNTGFEVVFFNRGPNRDIPLFYFKLGSGLGLGAGAGVGYFEATAPSLSDEELIPDAWTGWFNSYSLNTPWGSASYFWSEADNSQQLWPHEKVWQGAGASMPGLGASWAFTNYWFIGAPETVKPEQMGSNSGILEVDESQISSMPPQLNSEEGKQGHNEE